MKRIAIFQSDLAVGGIQKALVNILNSLDYGQYAVDLYLFDRAAFFDLPQHDNLRIIYLKPYGFFNRVVYFSFLYRFFPVINPAAAEIYDIAVDFNSYRNECAVGALRVRAKKRVLWIHNDMEIKWQNERKYRLLWHFFRSKFDRFDAYAAVSAGIIDGFRRMTGIADKPVTAIPNHIDTAEIFRKALAPSDIQPDPGKLNLCSMGRLCHQKGFDLLIDQFAAAFSARPDMHLYIAGDGPDRDKLTAQIRKLDLTDAVTLLGNLKNPFPFLNRMDAFVLASRYEGQGIVLWEAKALGLPLIFPRHLEKYNAGLTGTDDLAEAMRTMEKTAKTPDTLETYNHAIDEALHALFTASA